MGEIRKLSPNTRSYGVLAEALVTSESPLSGLEGGEGAGLLRLVQPKNKKRIGD